MESKPIRVLLADDHPLIREGLCSSLACHNDLEVVGQASSGEEALEQIRRHRPDVVVMDYRMPGMGGAEATRQIGRLHPEVAVVILTVYDSELYLQEAIRAGASGYVLKESPPEMVAHAIRVAAAGAAVVPRQTLGELVASAPALPRPVEPVHEPTRLSSRELDVLHLLGSGCSNKEIAARLSLAQGTVKKYVQSVISKLGASDRAHAAAQALRAGLIE